jgi:predicted DNA-binding transcriptional regulator AlpA
MSCPSCPDAPTMPCEPITLADALAKLVAILPRLADFLDGQRQSAVPRLAYRLDELAEAIGVSRRTIERERSAGRLPKPDLHIGRAPLWRPETIRRWIEGGRPFTMLSQFDAWVVARLMVGSPVVAVELAAPTADDYGGQKTRRNLRFRRWDDPRSGRLRCWIEV